MALVYKIVIINWRRVRFTYGVNGPPLMHIAEAREVSMGGPEGDALPTIILAPQALCGATVGSMWRRLTVWDRPDLPQTRYDHVCEGCRVRAKILGCTAEDLEVDVVHEPS